MYTHAGEEHARQEKGTMVNAICLREGLLFEFVWEGVGWGWALIRGWALINFSAFRMGAYSRWALIRINTVFNLSVEHFWRFFIDQQERIW